MATTNKTRGSKAGTRNSANRGKTSGARKATAKGRAKAGAKTGAKTGTRSGAGRSKAKAGARSPRQATAGFGIGQAISKAEFERAAERLQLRIGAGDQGAADFELDPREFSSGSFGWFASEKLEIPVGSKKVRCQMSLNVTVIGSKKGR